MKISRQFFQVDKKLLPVKIHYFLFMAALSCAIPFRAILVKQLGISATALGIIYAVVPFLKLIINPVIGFLLDYFKRYRLTISVIMLTVAFSQLALIVIPPREMSSFNSTKYRKIFKVNMENSCILQSVQEQRRTVVYVHSEWTYNDLKLDTFTCDISCSNDTIEKRKNDFHCIQIPDFQFILIINATSCNIRINSEINSSHDFQAQTELKNESSLGYLHMYDISTYLNISELNSHSEMNTSIRNENFNGSSETADFVAETKTQPSNSTLAYFNKSSNIKCYGELLYKIKFNTEILEKKCPCRSTIMCKVEYCSPTILNKENDSLNVSLYQDEYWSLQFWSLFTLCVISTLSHSCVIFMQDTICYEILQNKREKFGHQRLWGTVGWGIAPLVAGYLNQRFSSDDEINYAPCLILQFIIILFNLIPSYYLNVSNLSFSSNIWKDVCSLLYKGDVMYTMAMALSVGMLSGFIWNYQFWFMEEIGASQVLLGLSQTFECLLAEVPCFIASGWIIKKIGYAQCNSVTFICFGARYLYFAFMYDPWMSLVAALVHGPTFGLFYASMTAYVKEKAPPGTEATMQSLFSLSFDGLGTASGSFLGGMAIDKLGSRTAFLYSGVFSFILFIINIAATVIFPRIIKSLRSSDTNMK